ncbi:Abi-alpha family protein [Terriglobus sp. TAA 43]|uniref:Abi-alpha family protein n=1 Tax=Terriglobus sp. TAA 43 TaxID=278961 RepID=UPI0006456DC3|nr:Abi-alpha family protein [Terriglobus sp. TAA 43]
MDETQELAKDLITGTISETTAKVLETEVSRNLLLPAAQEVGKMMGQVAEIARFYANDAAEKIFTKWSENRKGRPVTKEEYKRVLPLLPSVAFAIDDEMHDSWARLLQATSESRDGVLPSFGQTLSQLTPEEARFLDRIWKHVTAPNPYNSGKRFGRDELTLLDLRDLYRPQLNAPSPAEMRVLKSRMTAEQIEAFEEMTNFELIINDLERLALLEKVVKFGADSPSIHEIAGEKVSIPGRSGTMTRYALSQYGVNFIQAVRPPVGN